MMTTMKSMKIMTNTKTATTIKEMNHGSQSK